MRYPFGCSRTDLQKVITESSGAPVSQFVTSVLKGCPKPRVVIAAGDALEKLFQIIAQRTDIRVVIPSTGKPVLGQGKLPVSNLVHGRSFNNVNKTTVVQGWG